MADFSTPGILYEEKQTFGQKWLMWLVGGTLLLSILPILFVLKGTDLLILIPFILFSMAMMAMMRKTGLKTQVREDGFYYRFIPFHYKTYSIPWSDVVDYEVMTYKPILDYGGWGMRIRPFRKDRAYNVSGNKGMKLYLKKGKKILFGTENPIELQEAMLKVFKPDDLDESNDGQAFDLKDRDAVVKEKIKLKDEGFHEHD